MQSIQTAQPMIKEITHEKVGEPYLCECSQIVQVMNIKQLFGPNKGEWFESKNGCKCEDMKLAIESVKKREQLKLEKELEKLDANSFVNDRLKQCSFANYERITSEQKHAVQVFGDFGKSVIDNECNNLLVFGSPGTGKSHLSYATADLLRKRGRTSIFVSLPKLLQKIKSTYNNASEFTESDFIELVLSVDLLVLDDLGAEYGSNKEWLREKMFLILDGRQGKSTIFTSNCSPRELEDLVGARNYSRMLCDTSAIEMTFSDYRRKK